MSNFFYAFSDDTRLKIIMLLTITPLCVGEITNVLDLNQTTISQWLLGKKKPSYDSIMAIYKNFGITPNELFGIERK